MTIRTAGTGQYLLVTAGSTPVDVYDSNIRFTYRQQGIFQSFPPLTNSAPITFLSTGLVPNGRYTLMQEGRAQNGDNLWNLEKFTPAPTI